MAVKEVVREATKWTRWWRRWSGRRRGVDMAMEEEVREAAAWTRRQRRRSVEEYFSRWWWWQSLCRTLVRRRQLGGRGVSSGNDRVDEEVAMWTQRRWGRLGRRGGGDVDPVWSRRSDMDSATSKKA
jgi:hypothetical protein